MNDAPQILRQISWRDIFPWLLIVKAFRLAISPPILMLAFLGVVLQPLGWRAAEGLFISNEVREEYPGFAEIFAQRRRWPGEEALVFPREGTDLVEKELADVAGGLSFPFVQFFRQGLPLTLLAYFDAGGAWLLLVWAFFGGAISRIAIVQLGREERVGLLESLWFTQRKLGSYFFAPIFPLLGVLLCAIPVLVLGWCMNLDVGVFLAGLLWLFALLFGFLMALLALGTLFSWPLMWGVISAEASDVFDALSRSFSYIYQRPLHYAFYAIVAAVIGGLGWILIALFAEATIALTDWAAIWGTGSERWREIAVAEEGAAATGLAMIDFFRQIVRMVAHGFLYSFFWCAAAAIYLLLRRDVDHAEFDEIYVEQRGDPLSLPPLKTDAAGVPLPPDTTASTEEPATEPAPKNDSDSAE